MMFVEEYFNISVKDSGAKRWEQKDGIQHKSRLEPIKIGRT
jgi:hypothetical protein